MSTGPPAQDQKIFVRTRSFFSFYLELYKNQFKNLIRTSKLKCSFQGLCIVSQLKSMGILGHSETLNCELDAISINQ